MAPTKTPKQRNPPKVRRKSPPPPSKGGTRGYSLQARESALLIKARGEEDADFIVQLRNNKEHPSKRSTQRWMKKLNDEGYFGAFELGGNSPATVLCGSMLLLLSFYRLFFPKCTHAELNAFLFNSTPIHLEPRFYSTKQLSTAEDNLGLSRKRGATRNRQSFLARNIARRHIFWNSPFPYGVRGIPRRLLYDFDEAAIFLETTDRGYGKCYIGHPVIEKGPYGHSQKYTLTLCVGANGFRHWTFNNQSGTTVGSVCRFLEECIQRDGGDAVGNERHVYLCDNLRSHTNELVYLTVQDHGHRLLPRAPYAAWDGPSEYVFNTIQQALSLKMHEIDNARDLELAIANILQEIEGFEAYFQHCGY